jgi:isoquinoline 1-oxidoreductase subunit beta
MSNTPKKRWRVSRRGFLIGAGVFGGALALGWTFGLPYGRRRLAEVLEDSAIPSNAPRTPDAWFEIGSDSTVTLYLTKAEMGQGIHTVLAQFAAEELEIPVAQINLVQATTARGIADVAGTAGSASVSGMNEPIRQAAATLREMLKAEASKTLGVPVSDLKVNGRAIEARSDAGKTVAFGALVAGKTDWLKQVPEQPVALKPREQWTVAGQSVARVDIPAKVTGQAIYGYDMRVEGMAYGAVLRPPKLEAKLVSAKPGTAESMPGVIKVVIEDGFAGVVASSRSAARSALNAIEATWDEGKNWQQSEIDTLMRVGGPNGVTIQQVGNAPAQLGTDAISAEYRTPLAIQTPMEAQAALADVKADRATIWTSTQTPTLEQNRAAGATGLAADKIEVHTTYLGGGFGRRGDTRAVADAARLSKAAGVPVHVGWSREEELRHGFFRPPTHHQLRATLDGSGKIAAIEHLQASGDVLFLWLPKIAADILGADFGAYRGSTIRYDIPNKHTQVWRRTLPMPTGAWRGLGALPNAFAVESFIDELAHAAKTDPLEFRLKHLGNELWDKRMRSVLEAVARESGWGTPLPAGRARGIACATDVDTVVAEVAEISLSADNRITVHQVTAAMDCGIVINPDGARAQVEGNVMWGVGSALFEEARVEDGRMAAANFDGYRLLSIKDAPVVKTVLVETGDKIRGVGEPAIAPVAAAIGNALFALTGKRLREIPFTPERIAAAR